MRMMSLRGISIVFLGANNNLIKLITTKFEIE